MLSQTITKHLAVTVFSKRSAALFTRRCLSTRITDYSDFISEISSRRQPSAIRKLMPLMAQVGMVSLGGGLPNPTLFPLQSLQFSVTNPDGSASDLTLSPEELKVALQYSPTPGLPKLLDQLKDLQKLEHGDGGYDLNVTVGSQDGLTKAFEMLLDPQHDELFVESPTYSGALAFLHPFGVKLTPVPTDEYGLHPDALVEALEASKHVGHLNKKRVLYTIPTAQNPSGSTLSNDRRQKVYEIAQEHNMIIMEDDPYYFLHPNREQLKSFLSMDTDGRVLRFDSMSKLISSGMRIGFATGPPKLMERLNFHIQATNLHNSGVSQVLMQKLLEHWGAQGLDEHARSVAQFYCDRRDVLLSAADRHLNGLAEWVVPEAGMFLWIKLLYGITDTKALIEDKAAKANVLFVPGQSFCPLDQKSPYVRASFSTASDEEFDIAMERLALLVKNDSDNGVNQKEGLF